MWCGAGVPDAGAVKSAVLDVRPGGRYAIVFSTAKFHDANPKIIGAVMAAMTEAMATANHLSAQNESLASSSDVTIRDVLERFGQALQHCDQAREQIHLALEAVREAGALCEAARRVVEHNQLSEKVSVISERPNRLSLRMRVMSHATPQS